MLADLNVPDHPPGPIQRLASAGSDQARHTRSRGASSRRVMESAVSALLTATFAMLRLLFQMGFEPVQALAPEVPIKFEPLGSVAQAARRQPTTLELPLAFTRDQLRRFQHLEVA